MLRVVADTNVFISALMFGGLPGAFLDLAFAHHFQLITSPVLLDELEEKLRSKFQISSADADLIRAKIERHALLIEPSIALKIVAEDPDDDRVIECAIAGETDYIVSGDRHLLKLESYSGVTIATVREFMDAAAERD
jgi:putative PIN family toxin of toxin-antitoxin system